MGCTELPWPGFVGPAVPLGSQRGRSSLRGPAREQHLELGGASIVVHRVPAVGHQALGKRHGFNRLSSLLPRHHDSKPLVPLSMMSLCTL